MSGEGAKVEGQVEGAPARPDYIPETAWDAATNTVKLDALKDPLTELGTLREFKTTAEKTAAEQAAARLAKPEDVKIALPEDFKLPDGLKFQVDPNDPIAAEFQKTAVANGWTQKDVTAVVGLFANFLLNTRGAAEAEAKAANEKVEAGFKEFGEGRGARVEAAKTWVTGGPLKDHAADLTPLLATASGIKALETIQTALKGVAPKGLPNGAQGKGVDVTGKTGLEILTAARAG